MSWFEDARKLTEEHYLASDEPWKQSGFSGPFERWETLRKPIAECIDRSGSFLDIGCANGFLIECLLKWSSYPIQPFGLDISELLVTLARIRVPTATFWRGNSYEWKAPHTFDFVRTELCYVQAENETAYLKHLLSSVVSPKGILLVANYAEDNVNNSRVFKGANNVPEIVPHLRSLGFVVESWRDGFDKVKGRHTRVAIIRQELNSCL